MKYAESAFDIFYLLFAVISGIYILCRRRDRIGKLMGSAALILGCGDAFHLVPRVLGYYSGADLTAWLGAGKLVTSVTMTVFYALMFRLWVEAYGKRGTKGLGAAVYALSAVRVILCALPQNRWLENDSPALWGVIRNAPFIALGAVIACIFFKTRKEIDAFRRVWLIVALSFIFYISVAVTAPFLPALGMLMVPKTVCYMLLIRAFLKYSSHAQNKE
ncbi:MAG: hypothetical protein IJS65_08345 [Clostridia bacterium]|nr:hypothetical protein [Clostridia bacterium]